MNNLIKLADLEKKKWTEADFEEMGWHDNKIYAMAFGLNEYEITFDIDYILKWTNPEENETHFKFIVVPAVLVFRNVYDLNISFSLLEVTIEDIFRDNPTIPKNAAFIEEQVEYDWTIETTNGEITFKSVGYRQYAKQKPIWTDNQSIDMPERGGISFNVSFEL